MTRLGHNVQYEIKGTILTLVVDLSQIQGESKTGKSRIIASTSGNQLLPHESGAQVGLNVFTKRMED